MTTAALLTAKSAGLARTGSGAQQLAKRVERARQSFNAKIKTAEAEYIAAVGRAYAELFGLQHMPIQSTSLASTEPHEMNPA